MNPNLNLDELDAGNELELTYDGSRGSRTVRGYVAHVETREAILDRYETNYTVLVGTPDDHTPRFVRLSFETTPEEEDARTYSFEENYELLRSMNSKSDRGQKLGQVEGVNHLDTTDDRGVQVSEFKNTDEGDIVRLGDREAVVIGQAGSGIRVEFENGDRENVHYSASRGVYYSVIASGTYEKTVHNVGFENTGYEQTPTDGAEFVWTSASSYGHGDARGKVEALVVEGDRYELVYRPTDSDNTLRLRSPEFDEDEARRNYDVKISLDPYGLRITGVYGNDLERETDRLDASEVELVYENEDATLDTDEDDGRDEPSPEQVLDRHPDYRVPREGDEVRVVYLYPTDYGTTRERQDKGTVENVRVSPGVGVELSLSGVFKNTAYALLHADDDEQDRLLWTTPDTETTPAGESEESEGFDLLLIVTSTPAHEVEDDEEDPELVTDGGQDSLDLDDVEEGDDVRVLLDPLRRDVDAREVAATVEEANESSVLLVSSAGTTARLSAGGSIYRVPDDEEDPFEELLGTATLYPDEDEEEPELRADGGVVPDDEAGVHDYENPEADDAELLRVRGEFEDGENHLVVYYRAFETTFRASLSMPYSGQVLVLSDLSEVEGVPEGVEEATVLHEFDLSTQVPRVPPVVRGAVTRPVQVPANDGNQ